MGKKRRCATVKEVLNGDTVVTSLGTVRLAGVDARELNERGGKADKARLEALVHTGDDVSVLVDARDSYGRLVGRIYKGRESVNKKLNDG